MIQTDVPDMQASSRISEIFEPLHWTEEKCQVMVDACREIAVFHKNNCPDIASFYEQNNFDPETIRTEEDIERIPPLGVTAMKYFLMTSRPQEKAVLKLTSSGTRGQKTQIWFDDESLARVQRMLDVYLEQEGMVSDVPTNYLVFAYDPDDAGDLGIAYTEKNQLRFAPKKEVFYCLKKDTNDQWQFQKERALEILEKYHQMGDPVRVLGMPAFLFEFVQYVQELKKTEPTRYDFSMPTGSLMITGGGWKAAEDKKISREEFRELCASTFGIPSEWIRDGYGMAEHSAPYFECKDHRLHVPVYNRLITRDPETMQALPAGQKGLLELVTPFNTMMPNHAILSTDWAIIDKEPCTCGWNAPTFTLLGRAGLSKHKACAISAEDIVSRKK